MPIIESPIPTSPLSQGDILKGIALFATKEAWLEAGGEPLKAPFKMCLVMSRPCVLTHKAYAIVAGIEKYQDSVPKGVDNFDDVRDFLTVARDGTTAPDVFYLGQLPGLTGRFCARLDSLHPIEIPADPSVRQKFLNERRAATLHPDFARDLHVRLFNTFANLGFDDHRWFSDQDLEWLVSQGSADLSAAEQVVNQLRALKASRLAEGKQFAESELANAEKKFVDLRAQVVPYRDELTRRQAQTASPLPDRGVPSG
jgi:hypothetical protein